MQENLFRRIFCTENLKDFLVSESRQNLPKIGEEPIFLKQELFAVQKELKRMAHKTIALNKKIEKVFIK